MGVLEKLQPSSPRPWGCFPVLGHIGWQAMVFPTPVGVFLVALTDDEQSLSLPHARGGVSAEQHPVWCVWWSSPRPWGCFRHGDRLIPVHRVFPTPVGVFPMRLAFQFHIQSLPHARGGVSISSGVFTQSRPSSPRPWGCFSQPQDPQGPERVFPTPVGVFPSSR